MTAFLKLVEVKTLPVQMRILGNLIGYFQTEIGVLSQVVHMWGFSSLDDRADRRRLLAADDEWRALLPELSILILEAENRILIPTSFSPLR